MWSVVLLVALQAVPTKVEAPVRVDEPKLATSIDNLATKLEKSNHDNANKPGFLTSILISITVVFITFVTKKTYDYVHRPLIELSIIPEKSVITVETNGNHAVYIRIVVSNIGYRVAKNCRLVMYDVKKVIDGQTTHDLNFNESKDMKFAYDSGTTKDIVRGVPYFVDVCKADANERPHQVVWILDKISSRYAGMLVPQGTYEIYVLAAADDCLPRLHTFYIDRQAAITATGIRQGRNLTRKTTFEDYVDWARRWWHGST